MARIGFATSPMDHLILGMIPREAAHYVGGSAVRDRWWRSMRGHVPRSAGPLMELCAASPSGLPDFMSAEIDGERRLIGDELDAIRSVSDEQVHADLFRAYESRSDPADTEGNGTRKSEPPRIVQELRDEGSDGLRRLTKAAWALYTECLAPEWPDIQRQLHADISRRLHVAAKTGVGALLEGLHPRLSWHDDGTLRYAEVPRWADETFELGGLGLELRPSVFLEEGIGFLLQKGRRPALFHPVGPGLHRDRPAPGLDGLVILVGPARARALRAVGRGPCTTKELADRLGIAASSTSAHTNALRAAGTITTTRNGREVRHALTCLGHDLLATNPEPGFC
ncbi:ArsR/SmtB family transcription factor [Embleya sp. AB8]|uniref:ArsR/SmtB family transcription factor n=1 Tax=Embleya sp. AB8 TaxID=3156304 RepID=UPI003C740750